MKRYGDLYTQVWDMTNIREAHKNAQRGKRHYREVQMVNNDPEKYLLQIQEMLRDKTFQNSEYEVFIKTDSGKEREIYKLPWLAQTWQLFKSNQELYGQHYPLVHY
jgi:hypothetical protein